MPHKARSEIPDVVWLDQVFAVFEIHLDEECTSKGSHAVQVGRHPDDPRSDVGVAEDEIDRGCRCGNGGGGAVQEIMWNGLAGWEAAEYVRVEMQLCELAVQMQGFAWEDANVLVVF